MVKRYYVVTAGFEVGVFYDHWTNVAPHVKNKRECVWQGASSREEAEDLFEQAMRKGNVHIIPNNHARSPTSSVSQAGSVQSSSSRSSSSRGNPQHSRHTSIPRLAGSQSERHVRSNASYYEPACTNPGEMNTNNSAWDKVGAGGSKVAQALSRTHSEPGQYAHSSNSVKGGGHSPSGISVSRGEVETRSQVKPDNTRIYARVESPSWLASYPDEEDEAFITPPLSPITSPMISSRLLGPSKSEPASTFSADFASASVIGKKPASDDGSDALNFRSPKPVHQAASFSVFSPRPQESLSGEADGVLGIGGQKQPQKDEANVGSSRPTPRRVDTTQIEQSRVESLIDLVNTVDRLVKDLRIQIVSPSTDDNPLPDGVQDRADETRYHSPTSALSEGRNDLPDVTSPCSGSPHLKRRQTNTAEPSELKNSVDMGVPSNSVLFSHSRGPSSPAPKSIHSRLGSPCKHCNGTGYSIEDDTSVLDRTGLSQPSLAPFHSHNVTQDPRSPFTGSKKLHAPVRPMTFGRPSPTIQPETLSVRPSPLIISPAGRG